MESRASTCCDMIAAATGGVRGEGCRADGIAHDVDRRAAGRSAAARPRPDELLVIAVAARQFGGSRVIVSDVSAVISKVVPITATREAFARLADGRDGLNKILVSPDA